MLIPGAEAQAFVHNKTFIIKGNQGEQTMSTVIFAAGFQSYNVSQIIYAGQVVEIPEERRKSENTHSFKVITTIGSSFCYFRSSDAAWKARGALGAMLDTLKPNLFRYRREVIDPRAVVTFGKVFELKTPVNDFTHAFVVNLRTADADHGKVWLRFKSEESAGKAIRALYASIHAAFETEKPAPANTVMEPVAAVAG